MNVTKAVTQPFVKIYNFIQREFAYNAQIDANAGYIPFSLNQYSDSFPNKLADLVQGSPTATACLSTQVDFVTGEGFNQGSELENKIINAQGLKFFRFHGIQSDSLVHNWGVASLVKYSKTGQITEIYHIPFGYCRLGKPDDNGIISKIYYNPYFGTSLYKKQDTEPYDVYNPDAAVVQLARNKKFKGQINWLGIRDKKHPFYPIPDYYSAKEWMNIEKNAGVYFDENLENGFLTPTILKLRGNPNDASGLKDSNDNDIPKGIAFDTEMTKNFSGAKRVGQIMTFWGDSKEEWPETEAFPTNSNADMHRMTDEHATRKITIATKVPAILANVNDANNFGGEQIRPAVKLMQQRVKRPQDLLIDYYADMLKRMPEPVLEPIMIVPYNPFPEAESIDPQVWAVMSDPEKRLWVKDHTEVVLIETAPAQATPAPVPPAQNKIFNLHFNSYPQKAKDNVKRALDWQEKMNATCLKPKGRQISEMILAGTPLGPKEIKRLSRYLSKQTVFSSHPYDQDCNSVLYDAWGGSEMMIWANEKVKELNGQAD
jgi:hypothetical protein